MKKIQTSEVVLKIGMKIGTFYTHSSYINEVAFYQGYYRLLHKEDGIWFGKESSLENLRLYMADRLGPVKFIIHSSEGPIEIVADKQLMRVKR